MSFLRFKAFSLRAGPFHHHADWSLQFYWLTKERDFEATIATGKREEKFQKEEPETGNPKSDIKTLPILIIWEDSTQLS